MFKPLPNQLLRFIASIPVIILLTAHSPVLAQQKPAQAPPPSQTQERPAPTPAPPQTQLQDRAKELESRANSAAPNGVLVPLAQILLMALGAFLGALLSFLATIAVEYQKKPKLQFVIESKPLVRTHPAGAPVTGSTFLRLVVTNKPMPKLFRWLVRSAAYQCTGDIQFHDPDDGAPLLSRAMPVRWADSDEPFSYQALPGGGVTEVFDPAKYNAGFRRDCFPGTPELVDVAARFENDDDCYGWSNESYLKGWRNPEFKLPKGRYLAKVTIRFSGEPIYRVFKLENSLARPNFKLLPASEEEEAKLRPQV
ncbi:MAG TPA: hypothetical protein VNH18_21575 [Bryobacteraceae bacterium]|nr:hypothetical protein [Bryobacteraceae bacterium]